MRPMFALLAVLAICGSASAQPASTDRDGGETVARATASSKPTYSARKPSEDDTLVPLTLQRLDGRESRSRGGGSQCRADCAQTYYFCSSEGDSSDCSSDWAQCSSRCPPVSAQSY